MWRTRLRAIWLVQWWNSPRLWRRWWARSLPAPAKILERACSTQRHFLCQRPARDVSQFPDECGGGAGGHPDTIPGEVWRVCIRTRDVGMIIWQVANVMNHMPEGNHKGAMDAINLLLCAWNRHPSMEEACKWGCSCRCRRSRQQLCSRLGRWQAPCTWDGLPRQQIKDGRLRLCNISRRWTWSQLDVRSPGEQASPQQKQHPRRSRKEAAKEKAIRSPDTRSRRRHS